MSSDGSVLRQWVSAQFIQPRMAKAMSNAKMIHPAMRSVLTEAA